MRSTSRNVRAMRRQERSLDLAQGRELHPAEGQRVGGCKKGIYPTVFQLTPRLLKTQTQAPRPLLKPAMDYLGLKGGQRGEGESKERPTQKGDPSPLQRPFRNKINGMCLSITPRELGGRAEGECGGFCPGCPASPTLITIATKAPCCLGDGSQVLEPIPSIQSEKGYRGGRMGQRGREWGFSSGSPGFCLSLGSGFSKKQLEASGKKIN